MKPDQLADRSLGTFGQLDDVMIPMRDGVRLATDLYLPSVDRPVPVILERTGYDKCKSPIHWTKSPGYFAARGYAVAVQDCRGIHASEGTYYPWKDDGWGDLQDGYDTIEWLAAQEWCDGNVGMFGGSYAGATQLRAAIADPPHLRALVVRQAPNNPLLSVRPNGVRQLTGGGGWITDQAIAALRQAERRLTRLQSMGSDDFFQAFPHEPFDDQLRWVRDWFSHDADAAYWADFDCVPHADRITVPILHIGSWYDLHRRSTVAMYRACAERSPAAGQQRLVIGPWIHGSRFHTEESGRYVGELDMGESAKLELNALMLRWFDHWLRGADNHIMAELPPVSYFLMARNTWKSSPSWPLPGTETLTFYATGTDLVADPPATHETRTFVDRRDDPARTVGGDAVLFEWGSTKASTTDPGAHASASRTVQRGPRDQRSQEHKGVTFTTAPLAAPLHLTGTITATIHFLLAPVEQADDACLIARLTDVYPGGRSIDIVDGSSRIAAPTSGSGVTVTAVDLGDTAIAIPEGHCLRLGVFASNFPRVPLRAEHDVEITVYTGPSTPTRVDLSISPTDDDT